MQEAKSQDVMTGAHPTPSARESILLFWVFNSVGQLYYGLDTHVEHMCHSCCVWTQVLWQVARQRSDGDRLVAAGLGQLVMGVTFIPLFYGRAPLVATERAVLALFCTPTS